MADRTGAARQQRYRRRQRTGRRLFQLELDEYGVIGRLLDLGLLDDDRAIDHASVVNALTEFNEISVTALLCLLQSRE